LDVPVLITYLYDGGQVMSNKILEMEQTFCSSTGMIFIRSLRIFIETIKILKGE